MPRGDAPVGAPRERVQDCYVYVQLPNSTETITCGRFSQEQTSAGTVGRFVYGRRYRARLDAVPIDPYHLPLSDRVQETAALGGIFGALRDASPDAWGRLVIQRALGRSALTEIDYLLASPEDRAGALSFGRSVEPPAPLWTCNRILRLPELMETARLIESHPSSPLPKRLRHAEVLMRDGGTSMGGARPKSVVEDDTGLWLAKFPARDDRWTNASVEAGMLALARRCGITTPITRLVRVGRARVLLVMRFDRERLDSLANASVQYRRHRMVSALTVLNADDSPQRRERWSYVLLADELRRWSARPDEDQRALFRRMVFNALVSSLDDHPRNHALIATALDWRLAPAYDVTPDPRVGSHERDLAMVCGRTGRRARRANLLSQSERFSLTHAEADAMVSDMVATIRSSWYADMRQHETTEADCAIIAPAFLDEGFEYDGDADR